MLSLCGCGSGKGSSAAAPVKGRVTHGNNPVNQATIQFESTDSAYSVWCELDSSGSYVIQTHDNKGLPPGSYRVYFTPTPQAGQATDEMPPTGPVKGQESKELSHPLIPPKYRSGATSGLRVEVRAGESAAFDFDLSK